MEAPAFADCAPRRAFRDLANSALVAESIADAAPRQTSNKEWLGGKYQMYLAMHESMKSMFERRTRHMIQFYY